MEKPIIDINADVGEGMGNEAQLIPYISSCNIACGGHAGDKHTMEDAVVLAKAHNVKIGAHPSFPDKENFGRVVVNMSSFELFKSLQKQITLFLKVLDNCNVTLHHIKPHGALYNLAAKDEQVANVIIEVVKSIKPPVKLYAPYKSVIADIALEHKIDVVYEVFADRHYNDDLSLVSRQTSNALIHYSEEMMKHVFSMIKYNQVSTITGTKQSILANTICVHGDTPQAINLIKNLHAGLLNLDYQIQ